jgi:hypothetical protein
VRAKKSKEESWLPHPSGHLLIGNEKQDHVNQRGFFQWPQLWIELWDHLGKKSHNGDNEICGIYLNSEKTGKN